MFGRWRKGATSEGSSGIKDAISAARAAEEAAREAANSAALAVDLIRELEEHRMTTRPLPWRAWALGCLGLLVLTAYLCVLIAPAFEDPAPAITNPGLFQVVVEEPSGGGSDDLRPLTDLIVVTSSLTEGNSTAFYTVAFPVALQGYEFRLLIAGSAAMKDLASPETPIEVQDAPCSDPQVVNGFYKEDMDCQVVSGTIGGEFRYPLQECRSDLRSDYSGNYIHMLFHGNAAMSGHVDWAHTTTNMPDLEGIILADPIDKWSVFELGKPMNTIIPTTCQELSLSGDQQNHSASATPSTQSPGRMEWGPDIMAQSFAVISTSRGAGAKGNLLLAGIGISSALIIWFVPVAYRSRRSWRRHVNSG